MRDACSIALLPTGKRFSIRVIRRAARVALAVSVLSILAVSPARAAVPVTLVVGAGGPVVSVPVKTCAVEVPTNADGADVLEAATTAGCISSYELRAFSTGRYVACIEGICDSPATYWRMTENGRMTDYGIDDFTAAAGDELGFSYTQWASCLTPLGC